MEKDTQRKNPHGENLINDFTDKKYTAKSAPPPAKKAEPLPPPETRSEPEQSRDGTHDDSNPATENRPRRSRNQAGGEHTGKSNRSRTGGQGGKRKTKEVPQRDPVDLKASRSSRTVHRVLPYVLILFASFLFITLILNLFCNLGNRLETQKSDHLLGIAGYYICYGLFGWFGPAVFVFPVLLAHLGINWRRFVDRRMTVPKIIASVLFLLSLGSLIHIFGLISLDRNGIVYLPFTASDLMSAGAKMTGGGVICGLISQWLRGWMNNAGALIVNFLILIISLFFLLGVTPRQIYRFFSARKELRSERAASISERDAESAGHKAKMDEKIRKIVAKSGEPELTAPDGSPVGAVQVVKSGKRREGDEKLAPIPIPNLEPSSGNRLFVPKSLKNDSTLPRKEAQEKEPVRQQPATPASSRPATPVSPRPATPVSPRPATPVKTAPKPNETPAPATNAIDPAPLSPEKNRDEAIDPIFPQGNEAKQTRKIPREHRNFDLKNIFIDLDDHPAESTSSAGAHAPLPPEVPLRSGTRRPTQTTAATAPQARPTGAPAPNRTTAPVPDQTNSATRQATRPTGMPASPKNVPARQPAPGGADPQKPIFRHADAAEHSDYGLTSEEFERMEAEREKHTLPTAQRTATAKKGAEKTAPTTEKTAAKPIGTAAKPAAPAKPAEKPAEKKQDYVFPPISYLHPGEPMTTENRAEIEQNMHQLAETLNDFRVGIREINYTSGPTVTRFEVIPAPGVRVKSIVNLSDDIALSLASAAVRIEAPIPGKSAVGVEIPNKKRSVVYLRDLIESPAFDKAESKITACLGDDVTGSPVVFNIEKMPHLLIAGTTGSGKSVCINCVIMSLLYKARPEEVKLILIDPKIVEFSVYQNIPHLLCPIVSSPKDAAGALQAAVDEMERRYEQFSRVDVPNIARYNAVTANDPDLPFMPQIVIIIDELADLMMTAAAEVETAICRIAQKARAAGIHLIVGTQRPSVDVVTGLIKSNIPSRIAFTVTSQVDSRTILDYAGAEKLTGRGDMLFVPVGAMKAIRVQGAFVDDKEVKNICDFLRATNGPVQFDEHFISRLKELAAQCGNKGKKDDYLPVGEDGEEKGDDPKYADAVRIAFEEQRISTSMLQRKLGVGYSRGAKLIDRMQEEGFVSPPDGAKPRTILITREQYMERFMNPSDDGDAES